MDGDRGRHLLEYWAVLVRRRWVVYLAVATVSVVALVGSFLVTPLYRGSATLLIERQNPDILTFRDLNSTDYSWAAYSDFYQTQYKILASDAVARRAVRRLGLGSHPAFEENRRSPGLYARIRSLLPGTATKVDRSVEDLATSWVQGALEVAPIRNSQLVKVSWVSSDPHLAADVANAVGDAFIGFNLETTFTATDQATEFLVNQIGTLKREIADIEVRLQDYGEAKRIVSIDDSSNITLKALADVAARRTQARAVLAEKEAAYRAVRESTPDALPEVLRSDLIARLKQEYASYEADYSEKSRLFKDDWPGMQTLHSKLEQARDRLELETAAIARQAVLAAESEYRRALAEVSNLDALLGSQEEAAQRLRRDSVEFANLQSEVQKKRETLNALIARQNEMALSTRLNELDAASSNIRIVDRAMPPAAPFRPNKKLNVALGLVLGLGLGVAMAFFLDYLDNAIGAPGEIERIVDIPILAIVPRHGPGPTGFGRRVRETQPVDLDHIAARDPRAPVSEAYRDLRTAILLSGAGEPPRRLMVTSALPEEGKSATAVNLAVVLAQTGRKVLLVDTDLRRPRLHRAFAIENGRGASTYLSGLEADPVSLVVATDVPGLDLLPSGPVPPNPSELLDSERFAAGCRALLEAGYDHVVFDSPPALSVADPVILASTTDAAILVARAGRTPRESLRLAAAKFRKAGIRLAGVVLNDLDIRARGYAHYHDYGRYSADAAPADESRSGDRHRAKGA